jgi:putative ABC transport system permease protein
MLLRNLRYSARTLFRTPRFTAPAIATLALGIAGCTVVFSVFDAIVLRPLPYTNASRLVMIWDQLPKLGIAQLAPSVANYFDYREHSRAFLDMAAFRHGELNLAGSAAAPPERVQSISVTPNMFDVLGVRPLIGQPPSEGGVLLSHELWQRRFGGDVRVIGRRVRLNEGLYQISGVMPAAVRFADIWLPLTVRRGSDPTAGGVRVMALLKPGVSLAQAQSDMTAVARGVQAASHPYNGPHGEDAGYRVAIVGLRDQFFGDFRPAAWLLFGAVLLVLIIACTNVANLLLTRRLARRREFAIRAALGAGGRHLFGELAAEALVLAACGGLLGVIAARWVIQVLPAIAPLPDQAEVRLDWRVVVFAIALVAATAVLFELAGGWWVAMRARLAATGARVVGDEARRSSALLVAGEVALSFVLLAGAGLLLKSFWQLEHVQPGFDPAGVLTMRITLPAYKYATPRQKAAFFENVTNALKQMPGIESAAVVSQLPLSGGAGGGAGGGDPFSIEGRPYRMNGSVPQVAAFYIASPGYFRTMRIPLLAGRMLDQRDGLDANMVAVVSETLARGFWPNIQDALGKRILMGAPRAGARWMTIAGVVGDVRNAGLRLAPVPEIYGAEAQNGAGNMVVMARTAHDPFSIAVAARRVVSGIDPDQPVYDVKTMEQQVASGIGRDRFQAILLAVFACVGLLLAAVGIYGVLEHNISRRIPEMGVRMAIGAQRSDILRLVMIQGMAPALIGMAAGCAGALGLTRVLQYMLFDASPVDPIMFAAAAGILVAVSLVACYLPARRAMRVDPATALRWE